MKLTQSERKSIESIVEAYLSIKKQVVELNKKLCEATPNAKEFILKFYGLEGSPGNVSWNLNYGLPGLSSNLVFVNLNQKFTDLDAVHLDKSNKRGIIIEHKHRWGLSVDNQLSVESTITQSLTELGWSILKIHTQSNNPAFDYMEPKIIDMAEQIVHRAWANEELIEHEPGMKLIDFIEKYYLPILPSA